MSFIISVYTNEGIIMASDSRTTYTSQIQRLDGTIETQMGVQITDSTYKTFLCNKTIGLSTCGTASINHIPITGYIEKFISEKVTEDSSVEYIAQEVLNYFLNISPNLDTHFLVAGYNPDDSQQHVVKVFVSTRQIMPISADVPGATWDGETTTLQRVLKEVGLKNEKGTYVPLPNFPIGFTFFTLQDAIDFAEYAVDITIKTMHFQNCIKTVGGPIDILAIKPNGAFWIQRKELHA